jgi:hypothetical protein
MSPISGDKAIYIPSSKTPASSGNSLAISEYWPNEELERLGRFIQATHHLPRETTLFRLAGIKRQPNKWEAERRDFLSKVAELCEGYLLNLYLPRTNLATWWGVRRDCAFDRALLNHPLLLDVRTHRWFQPTNLDKLCRLMGNRAGDSVEMARRVLGHATWDQFITRYNHGVPVQTAIRGYALNLKQAVL